MGIIFGHNSYNLSGMLVCVCKDTSIYQHSLTGLSAIRSIGGGQMEDYKVNPSKMLNQLIISVHLNHTASIIQFEFEFKWRF